jgi:hypothetical protein
MTCYLILNDDLIQLNFMSFNNFIINDFLAYATKFLICFFSAAYFLIISNSLKEQKLTSFEYLLITLFAVLGLLLMFSSNDLLTVYLSMELSSLSLYIIASFNKNSSYSIKSGLKYFITGALSSAFFLLGSSYIYVFSGSIYFNDFFFLFKHVGNFITEGYKDRYEIFFYIIYQDTIDLLFNNFLIKIFYFFWIFTFILFLIILLVYFILKKKIIFIFVSLIFIIYFILLFNPFFVEIVLKNIDYFFAYYFSINICECSSGSWTPPVGRGFTVIKKTINLSRFSFITHTIGTATDKSIVYPWEGILRLNSDLYLTNNFFLHYPPNKSFVDIRNTYLEQLFKHSKLDLDTDGQKLAFLAVEEIKYNLQTNASNGTNCVAQSNLLLYFLKINDKLGFELFFQAFYKEFDPYTIYKFWHILDTQSNAYLIECFFFPKLIDAKFKIRI